MIIDIYTHLAPRSFLDRMVVLAPKLGNIVNRLLAVKPLSDLDVRFRDMDTVPADQPAQSLAGGDRPRRHWPRTGAHRQ
jgi:hypothetical protein